MNWSAKTERNTAPGYASKKDFQFVEVEGGMGGKWGEVYGFFDIENPLNGVDQTDGRDNRRISYKGVGRLNLTEVGGLPVQLYGHIFNFSDATGFNDQNHVVGLGTAFSSGSFWIKPFLGVHHESKSFAGADFNGLMAGWVLGYSFKLGEQSFMITNWHETEFNRKDKFLNTASDAGGSMASSTGHNGAVSLWWNLTPKLTTGLSYRYADGKLGSATYQDALILTAKINF